jgi:O-antigen/teichoic acid export membrane protein
MSLKLLGKNTGIYALGNAGMRAVAFLLIPLYTHNLSISGYGLLATLQLTMQAMMGFMNSGMQISLVRFTKEFKDNGSFSQLLGTSSFIIALGGLIVSTISLSPLANFFRSVLHINNVYPYIWLTCVAALTQTLFSHLMAYYRAEEQALKFMLTGVLSSIVLILINSVFLYGFHLGVMGALCASITTYVVFLLLLAWDIFPKTGIGISTKLIPKLLHFGFPLIFSEFGLLVMGGVSIYFLSYYVGLESVAIFSLGSKLAAVLIIIIFLPFQLAFQPFLFQNLDKEDIKETTSRLLTYLVLIITIMFFFILVGSRILLPIIAPPEYSSAFLVILLLLPGIAFIGIYYIGETFLGAAKKTHIIGLVMPIFAIISIGLNYLLIPIMQWYGAVIATNISYVLAGVTFLMLGKKYFPLLIEWKRILICGCMIIFFFLVFLVLSKVKLIAFTVLSLLAGLGSIVILFRLKFFSPGEKILLGELLK